MTFAARVGDVPFDGTLRAVVTQTHELRYRAAPPESLDVPRIVRAASAVRRWRGHWAVVQDDVRALALADDVGCAELLTLPPAPDGRRAFDDLRGNKHAKPDFEAAVVLPDGRLVLFGSGAKPVRECVAVVAAPDDIVVRDAHDLYDALRIALGGAVPNIEGAIVDGDRLRLFQRATGIVDANALPPDAAGNVPSEVGAGARVNAAASLPPNAIVSVSLDAFLAWLDAGAALPPHLDVVAYRLGAAYGAALGFTDAASLPDGRIAFIACAEATADPTNDGAVVATRFGIIDPSGARQGAIVTRDGAEVRLKIEGLEPVPEERNTFVGVTDADDPRASALLVRLQIGERS